MSGKMKIFPLNSFQIADCRKIYRVETTVKYLQYIRKVNIRYKLDLMKGRRKNANTKFKRGYYLR